MYSNDKYSTISLRKCFPIHRMVLYGTLCQSIIVLTIVLSLSLDVFKIKSHSDLIITKPSITS